MIDDLDDGGKATGVWARDEEDDTTDFYQSPLGSFNIDFGHLEHVLRGQDQR